MDERELLAHLDRLHTTDMGAARIKRNLALTAPDAVAWCRDRILRPDARITRAGKNWYIATDGCRITVNASSYTVITAHKEET